MVAETKQHKCNDSSSVFVKKASIVVARILAAGGVREEGDLGFLSHC